MQDHQSAVDGKQINDILQFMIDIEIIDTNKARVLDAQRFSQASV